MIRAIALVLACCMHTAPSQASVTTSAVACTDGLHQVVMAPGASSATYSKAGVVAGTSACGGTRMAAFSVECRQNPAFQFLFASIPGPPILGGKSARLTTSDGESLLACRFSR